MLPVIAIKLIMISVATCVIYINGRKQNDKKRKAIKEKYGIDLRENEDLKK